MRKLGLPILTFCLLFSLFLYIPLRSINSDNTKTNKIPKKDRIDLAIEQEYQLTKDPTTNKVPTERLFKAKSVRDKKLAKSSLLRVSGITWQERGPSNVGGRTRALLFDLSDATSKKVWSAGVGGGLWYTNDISSATPVWDKVNDFFDNIAITSIIQNPANPLEMYFGTGEGWFNSEAIRGLGIWKSINGGTTWTWLSSTTNFAYVNDLLIDNNGNLYASVRAEFGTDASGIQKSSDGGATWTQVLGAPVFGSSARGADLELAANGDIYATLGIFDDGGIYRSNGGTTAGNAGTWTNITPNTSGTINTPSNYWHRIELACAPSNSAIVYALFQGYGSNSCTSVQQFNSVSNTWSVQTVPNINDAGSVTPFSRNQAWYNLSAAVDPNNANSLYVGGIDAVRSDDGGSTWTQMTSWSIEAGFTSAQNVHADQHAIVFAPGSSSKALWGTDGGVDYTENANIISTSKPTFANKNTGYNVTQFYSVAAHPSNSNFFLAGAQDNGTQRFSSAGMNTTTEISGGDGAFCHIDQDNPNIQISSYVYNNYFVSTNGGSSFSTQRFFNNNGSFINPTDYDDAANVLYTGNTLGSYFRWNDPATAGTSTASVTVSSFAGRRVTHVAVSPLTSNRVYFGLDNGSVVKVDDAQTGSAKTGTVIKAAIPGTSVSSIAIDIADENHLLVTYSNYGATSIYESYNANQITPTWSAVEGNLPDMPVRWIVFDPRNSDWAIIATELGVWSTDNLDGAATNWEPTNSGLANVRVDMLQYRSSDRTLVAATHGRGLFTTTIPNVTTPDINFVTNNTAAAEEATSVSGCRTYKEISVTMSIANAPVGDALATLSVKAGNTAIQGQDFDFTTNNDFASPSNVVTFSNGTTANKTITIRVYDDAEIESAESFTFAYALSGTTNAVVGTSYQEHTVTITDNDIVPASGAFATLGNPDYILGSAASAAPFNATLQYHKSTILYKASELTAAGFSAGYIKSISLNLIKNSTRPYQNLQIKMGGTAIPNLLDGGYFAMSTSTVASFATYTTTNGWNNFLLNTPFYWNGTNNLVIEICYDNGSVDGANAADRIYGYSDGGSASQGNFYFADNLSCSASYGGAVGGYLNGLKPQLQLTIGSIIASTLNTTKSEYLGANGDVYFYSATGEILARIKNLSSHDYGCTQVTLDRAGSGAMAFTNNSSINYLANKTFRVIPTTNNSTGSYQITLYYTQAEVQAWETATGQSWTNVQLVKVPSYISNYSVATPAPDGPGAIQTVTPVRGTYGSHATLTYTFATGFSGFGAGIPANTALPVTLLNFQGKAAADNVILNWSTSSEQGTKHFEIERSNDGLRFYKIGLVNAAGNSQTLLNYSFTDQQPGVINYYRLRMVDQDGSKTVSSVITIKFITKQKVWVLNNPFQHYIDIRFSSKPDQVSVQLLQLNGNLIEEKLFNNPTEITRWYLRNQVLSKNVYLLKTIIDGTVFINKVVKE